MPAFDASSICNESTKCWQSFVHKKKILHHFALAGLRLSLAKAECQLWRDIIIMNNPTQECSLQAQGDLWRALGILTAAGALRTAVLLLRKLKLPDRAAVYIEAAHASGFGSHAGNSETGQKQCLDAISPLLLYNYFHNSLQREAITYTGSDPKMSSGSEG